MDDATKLDGGECNSKLVPFTKSGESSPSIAPEHLLTILDRIEERLTKLEQLPDTAAIIAATKEVHAAHEQFANTTRSLQERMVDAAQIKAAIDVIRNRCNNIMQLAPAIENIMGLFHSFAGKLGGSLRLVEGIYMFQPRKPFKAKKAVKK